MTMTQFIFYTFEGYTLSPNNTDIENLQILGVESGLNQNDALEKLLASNKWIEESGFSKEEIKNYATQVSHLYYSKRRPNVLICKTLIYSHITQIIKAFIRGYYLFDLQRLIRR